MITTHKKYRWWVDEIDPENDKIVIGDYKSYKRIDQITQLPPLADIFLVKHTSNRRLFAHLFRDNGKVRLYPHFYDKYGRHAYAVPDVFVEMVDNYRHRYDHDAIYAAISNDQGLVLK